MRPRETCHELKTTPEHFQGVWNGAKPFECRIDDRNFEVDDWLTLNEWHVHTGYTGRQISGLRVTYKLSGFQEEKRAVRIKFRQRLDRGFAPFRSGFWMPVASHVLLIIFTWGSPLVLLWLVSIGVLYGLEWRLQRIWPSLIDLVERDERAEAWDNANREGNA